MAKIGYTPQDIDLMEVWQVAALLGMDERVIDDEDTFLGRPLTEADKERLRRFSTSIESADPDITDQVMQRMGIVTRP